MKLLSPKSIVLLTVFIDIIGLGIVIPVLPFYVQNFNSSALAVTGLFTVFSLCSFISAPFLGALSDRFGRRPILLVSIASTALGWLVFASAGSLVFLFIGRIIDGLAAGNFPIAQSYLADLAKDDKERTHNLGLIGAMFGIGLTIGPLLGGLLSTFGHSTPFWFAGILATANLILAFFSLPETLVKKVGVTLNKITLNPLKPLFRSLKDKKLLSGFIAWFLFGCAIASQQAVFTLFIQKQFGFGSISAGWLLTGMGVVLALNQAVLLKRFWLKFFSEKFLEKLMFLVLAVGFALMAIGYLPMFFAGMIFLTLSHSVLRVVMNSRIIATALDRKGEILGTMSSIMSLSMIVGPLGAGLLFEYHASGPFVAAALTALIAFVITWFFQKRSLTPADEEVFNIPASLN